MSTTDVLTAVAAAHPNGYVIVDAQDFTDMRHRVQEGGMREDWRHDVLMRMQNAEEVTASLLVAGTTEAKGSGLSEPCCAGRHDECGRCKCGCHPRAAILAAALHNLELDLNGKDHAAIAVVRAFVGDDTLAFTDALDLVTAAQ